MKIVLNCEINAVPEGQGKGPLSALMVFVMLGDVFDAKLSPVLLPAVYPDRCTINLAAVGDLQMHQERLAFWDDVYGFEMGCMKKAVLLEASVDMLKAEVLISEPAVIQVRKKPLLY